MQLCLNLHIRIAYSHLFTRYLLYSGFHTSIIPKRNMSETVFNASLTENEKVTIRQRVRSGCELSAKGHLVVDGVEKDQYSRVRIYLRGKSYMVNRAKACIFADNDFAPLPQDLQVSHLCHVKNCVLKEHLTMESASLNNSRKKCVESQVCLGHSEAPNCIFL